MASLTLSAIEIAVASALLGTGWGLTYSLAPVSLTRLVTADERVRFFAMHSVFLMAGFGSSPVLAWAIEEIGYSIQDAFLLVAILCAVAALIFFILIKPIRSNEINDGKQPRSSLTIASIGWIFRTKAWLPVTMVFLGASVFAGMNNFQTVFADDRGLVYSTFFLVYTVTVVICRILLASFKGGKNPYLTIALLQFVMAGSVILFIFSGSSFTLYVLVAILFGIGYGASYPVLAAMAANDAREDLVPQTLQLFALTYFVGIFGFPFVAGWMIVEGGTLSLLVLVAVMAAVEATMAMRRALASG